MLFNKQDKSWQQKKALALGKSHSNREKPTGFQLKLETETILMSFRKRKAWLLREGESSGVFENASAQLSKQEMKVGRVFIIAAKLLLLMSASWIKKTPITREIVFPGKMLEWTLYAEIELKMFNMKSINVSSKAERSKKA